MRKQKSKSIPRRASNSNASPRQKASSSERMVTAPVQAGYQIRNSAPEFTICHREMVGPLSVPTANSSKIFSYYVNPGRASLFPWLSSIATSFDSYRFRRLTLEWIPKCSTATNGDVIMAIDYHCTDAPPVLLRDLAMAYRSVNTPLYAKIGMSLDISRLHFKSYFTSDDSHDPDPTREVARLDLGLTSSVTGEVGTLWVSYEVVFSEPQMTELLAGGELGDSRAVSLNSLDGPYSVPNSYTTSGNYTMAYPTTDSVRRTFTLEGCEGAILSPDGQTLTLPSDYQNILAVWYARAISNVSWPAINYGNLKDYINLGVVSGVHQAIDLANTATTTPWTVSTGVFASNSYVYRRGRSAGDQIVLQPRLTTALASTLTKWAFTLVITRISEAVYESLYAG